MRICPNCNREWPEQANFCPMDGTVLTEANAAPAKPAPAAPKSAPRPRSVRPGSATRIVQDATKKAVSGIKEAPAAKAPAASRAPARAQAPAAQPTEGRPAQRPAASPTPSAEPESRPDQAATVAEMPAVRIPETPSAPVAAAPRLDADTLETPVTGGAEADTVDLPPSSTEKPAPAGPHFSETAWFMAATDLEDMEVLDDDIDVTAMEEKYMRDGSNPEEVRKKFSLTLTDMPEEAKAAIESLRKQHGKKGKKK